MNDTFVSLLNFLEEDCTYVVVVGCRFDCDGSSYSYTNVLNLTYEEFCDIIMNHKDVQSPIREKLTLRDGSNNIVDIDYCVYDDAFDEYTDYKVNVYKIIDDNFKSLIKHAFKRLLNRKRGR